MKTFRSLILTSLLAMGVSGCTGFIYRIDVPQGNYLEQKDIDKLRIDMTREQVVYVLGRPLVKDSFDHDTWYYVYKMKRGMSDDSVEKTMRIEFSNDRVAKITGNVKLSEDFNTPLEQ